MALNTCPEKKISYFQYTCLMPLDTCPEKRVEKGQVSLPQKIKIPEFKIIILFESLI